MTVCTFTLLPFSFVSERAGSWLSRKRSPRQPGTSARASELGHGAGEILSWG